ncbi:YceI family protein [Lysobacter arvi]|uniref:YceI family protein n=1 Tax=Lysobacter arvi TaxID=3038776 RepID=A0ABU1CIR6_9GAMM|nr:YceI family protein [Lysobacter arvi]MDR0184840.1 YceI family protein [Lysobacter arvi]
MRERRPHLARFLLPFLLAFWPAWAQETVAASEPSAPTAPARAFDPQHTRFGFELRTRWGQRVTGQFPRYEGEVSTLADGRRRVRIVLRTDAVVVTGSDRYTALARGPSFFDAQRFPTIEFVSEPHADTLVRTGGRMRGRLSMHGVTRMETFTLSHADCEHPGRDCDVVATGSISRDDYGLDGWQFALADRVRFMLRVRLVESAP